MLHSHHKKLHFTSFVIYIFAYLNMLNFHSILLYLKAAVSRTQQKDKEMEDKNV